MNPNNFSQQSNIMGGSDAFNFLPFYLQSINVPGISFSHPELGGRTGSRFSLSSDTAEFGELSFSVILDEKFELYNELMQVCNKQLDFENGISNEYTYDFWISITDSSGNEIIKWTFKNTKISSIGDIQYSYTSDEVIFNLDLTMKFDYFQYTLLGKDIILPNLMI